MPNSRLLVTLLAALPLACSAEPPPSLDVPAGTGSIDLLAPGSMQVCRSGGVDLADPSQHDLAIRGWHLDGKRDGAAKGVWSSSADPALFLPLASTPDGDATLSVVLNVPEFHRVNFELGLTLNGASLGRKTLAAGPGVVTYELEEGMLTAGLNRIEFDTTAPVSPAERGVGRDRRELGFSLVGVLLEADAPLLEPMSHRRWVAQAGTELTWSASGGGAKLLVQDADDGSLVLERELADPGGRVALSEEAGDVHLVVVPGGEPGASPLESLVLDTDRGFTDLIVIVVDTLRADAIGPAPTPSLDALAAESVVFDSCFSHAPITLPSHTSLFASRLPHDSGVVNNGQTVPEELPLLAEILALHGYRALAGVSLGTLWFEGRGRGDGLARGFQTYTAARQYDSYAERTRPVLAGLLGSMSEQQPLFLFAHYADPHEPYRSQFGTEHRAEVHVDGELLLSYDPSSAPYLEHRLELAAGAHRIEFRSPGVDTQLRLMQLRGEDDRFLSYEVVEGELMTPSELQVVEFTLDAAEAVDVLAWTNDHPGRADRFVRYGEEIRHVDAAIGDLIAQLKEVGRWEDSLVVFTSDHGEGLGQHGLVGHVDGLWDEQLHVPLYVKLPTGPAWSPLREQLDQVSHRLVRLTDLTPTLLELLGMPPIEGAHGRSLLDPELVDGPSREVLAETHAPEARFDQYVLRDERYKLLYIPSTRRFQMFDVEADPGELTDVFAEHGDEVAAWQVELRELARRWKRDGAVDVDAEVRARLDALGY